MRQSAGGIRELARAASTLRWTPPAERWTPPANPNAMEDHDVASGKYALEPTVRALLLDMGLRPTAVLRRAGLRADLLSHGHVWLTQDEYFNLWRAVETEAGDPNFVLTLTEAFSPAMETVL